MNANVTIITMNAKDALCVPNLALKYVPKNVTEKFKEQGIWVLKSRKPERIEIKTGLKDGDFTQIISDDIQEGTEVLMPVNSDKKKNSGGPPRMF